MLNNFREFFEVSSMSDDIQRYRILWKSVIAQAVIDATSNSKRTESLVEKCKTISWLSNFSQDFIDTCILADCDPVCIRNKVQPILRKITKFQ